MKFMVDMQLAPQLARWLREKGHDAVHATEIGMNRASDEEILERSLKEDRVVITADLDYPRILALTQAKGPGIVLFRGGDYNEKEVIDWMTRVLVTIPILELPDSFVVVEKKRLRRRKLPLK